jgi:hypothetical protein
MVLASDAELDERPDDSDMTRRFTTGERPEALHSYLRLNA